MAQSKLQKWMTLSTTQAENIVATKAGKETWLKRFLQDLKIKQDEYVVQCDGHDLSKGTTFHRRTKHIDICNH